jgi:hypothetical protein
LEELRLPCECLSPYAVEVRYPGAHASAEDAREALACAGTIRAAARVRLGLSDP